MGGGGGGGGGGAKAMLPSNPTLQNYWKLYQKDDISLYKVKTKTRKGELRR